MTGVETLDPGFAGPASFADVGRTIAGLGFKTLEALVKDFAALGLALLAGVGEELGLDDDLVLALPKAIARTLWLGLDVDSSAREDEEDVVGVDAGVLERSLPGERGRAHLTVFRVVGARLMRDVTGGQLVFSFPVSASLASWG